MWPFKKKKIYTVYQHPEHVRNSDEYKSAANECLDTYFNYGYELHEHTKAKYPNTDREEGWYWLTFNRPRVGMWFAGPFSTKEEADADAKAKVLPFDNPRRETEAFDGVIPGAEVRFAYGQRGKKDTPLIDEEKAEKEAKEYNQALKEGRVIFKEYETPGADQQHELETASDLDLLRQHADALKELRRRDTIRTSNNPVGDYAETLFCRAFGWEQAPNSEKDADAIGSDGTRYQIKARRLTQHNASRQLGALRRLPHKNFDILAAVLFTEDFSVMRAALIPHALAAEKASYVKATNSWRFLLTDDIWSYEGVVDVTDKIIEAAK